MDNEVYEAICKLLEGFGFEKCINGDMYRRSTGCRFDFECLSSYPSVVDFQLEWHYAK
jgi:hypothetical protein